jgi:L-seryl-tRNA(Ser) seleniumtransferase/D-glucosaminate-6-phosphate ammonia-lyase
MSIYQNYGVREVINACGKMTILGVSTPSPLVMDAMTQAGQGFVVMKELQETAGKRIAAYAGAEAGCITHGAAAGIALSVAAVITKGDYLAMKSLPFFSGSKKEILIQKGHVINFGASIAQMIHLGGGLVKEFGEANHVTAADLKSNISPDTAGILFVQSHHTVHKGELSLEETIAIAKHAQIPIIVDAAAEESLTKFIAAGADLVIYSGGKSIEGPTSGFIAGKKNWIEACALQYEGIGRAMKVSKESTIGLLAALNQYQTNPPQIPLSQQESRLEAIDTTLSAIPGLHTKLIRDEAGREIIRLELSFQPSTLSISVPELANRLEAGSPAIYLRKYQQQNHKLHIDPRTFREDQIPGLIRTLTKTIMEVSNELE